MHDRTRNRGGRGVLAVNHNYSLPTELLRELESEGETATEEIATRARDRGLDAVTAVREGFPTSALLDYAGEDDIDLIAMGTAGRTGSSRYLMESTTERIIRHRRASLCGRREESVGE